MNAQSSEFYTRQTALPSVGRKGLAKLRSMTVAVAGVGGVGSSAAYYLARSGVGRLRLIDQDIVEPSNLQRVHSASTADLFHPKAEVLSRKLSEFDLSTEVDPVVETITGRNVDRLLEGADLLFDGLDNFRTRYLLNRFAVRSETPYLFVSAVADQAHLALLNPPKTACLECFMPHVMDRFQDSCETLGVTPTITGIAGAIGAGSIVRFLLGEQIKLTNRLMTIDMTASEFLLNELSKRYDCPTCGNLPKDDVRVTPNTTLLCGERTANVLPSSEIEVDLMKVSTSKPAETILGQSESVLVYRDGPYTISLFKNGRLLIGGIDEEKRASKIANLTWQGLRESGLLEVPQ